MVWKKLLRRGTALLLAGAVLVNALGTASASTSGKGEEEALSSEQALLNNMISAVQPLAAEMSGSGAGSSAVAAAEALPSWNLLTMAVRDAFIYETQYQQIHVSADGRYVAYKVMDFRSGLMMKEVIDVFDRLTGAVDRISVPADQAYDYGMIMDFDMSADARYVVFSYGSNLYEQLARIFLFDRETRELKAITPQEGEGGYYHQNNMVSISADGRYIAFDFDVQGLVPEDQDDNRDVYLYDRITETIEWISTEEGMVDEYGDSSSPSISADGRYIVFQSDKSFTDDETYYMRSIYLYDREATGERFRLISKGMNDEPADGYSENPLISADGQVIAFESDAANLTAGDENETKDVFVYDLRTNETKLVSVRPEGDPLYRRSYLSSISEDGKYVGYFLERYWGDYEEEDLPEEAFITDTASLAVTRIEVPGSPYQLKDPSGAPIVALGGDLAAFQSSYIRNFMGFEYEETGIFLAIQGEAPTWPVGSQITPLNESVSSITLSWPDAVDPSGIVGYHIYQDDARIGYVPYGSEGGNRFTASGWFPGSRPVFRIEAVNGNFIESSGGLTYQLQDGGDPTKFLSLGWYAERNIYGDIIPDGKLTVSAYGAPGKQVAADVTYTVWTDDTTQETRSAQLIFEEKDTIPGGYGEYEAEWILPEGISRIDSLTAVLTDPAVPSEPPITASADDLPVNMAGKIIVEFDNPYNIDLTGAYFYSYKSRSGVELSILDGSDTVTAYVTPDRDYTFRLHSSNFLEILGETAQVQTSAGKTKVVSMLVVAPAELRVRFVDQYGKPVDQVRLDLFDSDDKFIKSFTSNLEGWTDWHDSLSAGQRLVAKISIGKDLFEPAPNQEIVLAPGRNEQEIQLQSAPRGTLAGIVTGPGGQPVRNAQISATQLYQGREIVSRATSNLEGAYRLELLAGPATVEVFESSNYYQTDEEISVQVAENSVTTLNINIAQPERGIINLEVRVKSIKDTEFSEPLDLARENLFASLSNFYHHTSGYTHNAYYFFGHPGQQVNVCVGGTVADIPSSLSDCTVVTLDEQANATAQLFLEEKGGRITGTLDQTNYISVYGTLYRVNNGLRQYVANFYKEQFGGAFELPVPEAGTYELQVTGILPVYPYEYEYAKVSFTIADKQILPLGALVFNSKKVFKDENQNFYTALKNRVVPGGTITLRAGYQAAEDATDASLVFSIPEGMTPVRDAEGRIVINETEPAGEVGFEVQTLSVPVGNLTKNQPGYISFQLKIDPEFNAASAGTSAQIRAAVGAEQVEETLGNISLDIPVITLVAPKIVSTSAIAVNGVAPPGSNVHVYGGQSLLGSTTASATGYWEQRVTLPELGDPSFHALHAETETSGVKLTSETVYVEYNTTEPRLLEVAMSQAPNGKWVTLDVGNQVPRFPYSVVPGNPFQFELKFDRPDDIESVSLFLDGQLGEPIKAVREGGLYRAVVPATRGSLGSIYVDYRVKEQPFVADNTIPTIEEIKDEMPPGMKDFELEVTEPFALKNGVYTGTVEMTFPGLDQMTTTVTLTIDPSDEYEPTAEELAEALRTGLPMYNSSFGVTETEDELITSVKGYLPLSVLFPDGLPEELNESNARSSFAALDVRDKAISLSLKAYTKAELPMGKEMSAVKGQYDMMNGFSQKVNRIMSSAQASGSMCYKNIPRTVNQAGKALAATIGGEVAKYALKGWVGAMGLTGPGAAVAGFASKVVSKQIDNYVEKQISKVGTGYNECRDDVDRQYRVPDNGYWREIADPNWIYDPSGYVYEAVPSNRLEGVLATVLYQDPDSSEWVVWDAVPFEQINPHYTDSQGQYGWDVPPGKWKVVWEKEGYERQESAELDVPPPHTEVHAGLVSWEPPAVKSIAGVTGSNDSYVYVEFTKYLRVGELPAEAVTVKASDGTVITGTLAYVETQDNPADPEGADLARTIRFTPQTVLSIGASYSLQIDASYIQSYAGVWMTEDAAGEFTVVEKDERGPQAIRGEYNGGRVLRVVFDEEVASEVDVSKIILNGYSGLVISAVKSLSQGGEATILLTLSAPLVPGAANELVLQEGTASDPAGNASARAVLTIDAPDEPSDNALLASLQAVGAELTPAFDPATFEYTVLVPAAAVELRVAAATADPNAQLSIGGMDALNNTPRSVYIPDDRVIEVLVTAEDGTTTSLYTIQVIRQPAGNDAALSSLAVTPGMLAPAFDPAVTTYSVEVEADVTELTVIATANDPKAKSITINGAAAESGVEQAVDIPVDGLITITVTAENGVTEQTYHIQVTRKPAPVEVNVALTASAYELQTTEAVTVTATVYGNSGAPMGTVTFFDGTTPLSTVALQADGTASFTTTSLQAGTFNIIAVFNGDAAYPAKPSEVAAVTFVAAQPGPVLNYILDPVYSTTPRGVQYVSGFTLTLVPPVGMTEIPASVYRLNGEGEWQPYLASISFGFDVMKVEYQSTDSQGVTGPAVVLDFMEGVFEAILGR